MLLREGGEHLAVAGTPQEGLQIEDRDAKRRISEKGPQEATITGPGVGLSLLRSRHYWP